MLPAGLHSVGHVRFQNQLLFQQPRKLERNGTLERSGFNLFKDSALRSNPSASNRCFDLRLYLQIVPDGTDNGGEIADGRIAATAEHAVEIFFA